MTTLQRIEHLIKHPNHINNLHELPGILQLAKTQLLEAAIHDMALKFANHVIIYFTDPNGYVDSPEALEAKGLNGDANLLRQANEIVKLLE